MSPCCWPFLGGRRFMTTPKGCKTMPKEGTRPCPCPHRRDPGCAHVSAPAALQPAVQSPSPCCRGSSCCPDENHRDTKLSTPCPPPQLGTAAPGPLSDGLGYPMPVTWLQHHAVCQPEEDGAANRAQKAPSTSPSSPHAQAGFGKLWLSLVAPSSRQECCPGTGQGMLLRTRPSGWRCLEAMKERAQGRTKCAPHIREPEVFSS